MKVGKWRFESGIGFALKNCSEISLWIKNLLFFQSKWIFKMRVISIAPVGIPLTLSYWFRTNQLLRSQYQASLLIIISHQKEMTLIFEIHFGWKNNLLSDFKFYFSFFIFNVSFLLYKLDGIENLRNGLIQSRLFELVSLKLSLTYLNKSALRGLFFVK